MLTLTWEKINSQDFVTGVQKLNRCGQLDGKNAYRIGRIFHSCDKALRECSSKEREMRLKLCVVDEKGEPGEFKDEAAKKEFETGFKAMLATTKAEIKVHPIDFSAVAQVKGIAGTEMVAMEEIISGIPEVA